MKTDLIRALDVFVYAPALWWVAGKQKDGKARFVVEIIALTTLLYNGYNLNKGRNL